MITIFNFTYFIHCYSYLSIVFPILDKDIRKLKRHIHLYTHVYVKTITANEPSCISTNHNKDAIRHTDIDGTCPMTNNCQTVSKILFQNFRMKYQT